VKPKAKRAFRDFIIREAGRSAESDPIEVVRQIAAFSDDVFAQLKSIRMLAHELASSAPPSMEHNAKWKVVR